MSRFWYNLFTTVIIIEIIRALLGVFVFEKMFENGLTNSEQQAFFISDLLLGLVSWVVFAKVYATVKMWALLIGLFVFKAYRIIYILDSNTAFHGGELIIIPENLILYVSTVAILILYGSFLLIPKDKRSVLTVLYAVVGLICTVILASMIYVDYQSNWSKMLHILTNLLPVLLIIHFRRFVQLANFSEEPLDVE